MKSQMIGLLTGVEDQEIGHLDFCRFITELREMLRKSYLSPGLFDGFELPTSPVRIYCWLCETDEPEKFIKDVREIQVKHGVLCVQIVRGMQEPIETVLDSLPRK